MNVRCLTALVALATVVVAPTIVTAQVPARRAKVSPGSARPVDLDRINAERRPSAPTAVALRRALELAQVTESEPNDTTTQADSVALGDTTSGVIDPAGDRDFYGLDIAAGTTIALEVLASRQGSALDPVLWLLAPDSVTVLASNDDYFGLDSYLEFTVSATGRYFVGIVDYSSSGDSLHFYALSLVVTLPAPGDPTIAFTNAIGPPWGMAAGKAGELYVTNPYNGNVSRIVTGTITTLTTLFPPTGFVISPTGVVVDGQGNLLVGWADDSARLGVTRITPSGQRTEFASPFPGLPDCCLIVPITVGPDGDVWVGDNAHEPGQIRHYDPLGNLRGVIDINSSPDYVLDLAFSPTGQLHFTNGFGVYRIVNGVAQVVMTSPSLIDGIAFDNDGYLYIANSDLDQVHLLDPAGVTVNAPFARTNLFGRIHLAFLRAADGAMTSRLLAASREFGGSDWFGEIVEMNPAGMRAAGFRVGVDLLQVATTSLRAGMVGADYADTLRLVAPPGPVTWSVPTGTPPPGVTLDPATGVLSGVPTDTGTATFTVRADAATRFGFGAFTITVTAPAVEFQAAATALLGGPPLDAVQQRFLDLQGNRNGRFDIGDVRAYLRARGQLPAAAALARMEHP